MALGGAPLFSCPMTVGWFHCHGGIRALILHERNLRGHLLSHARAPSDDLSYHRQGCRVGVRAHRRRRVGRARRPQSRHNRWVSLLDRMRRAVAGTIAEIEDAKRAATVDLVAIKAGAKLLAARGRELAAEAA